MFNFFQTFFGTLSNEILGTIFAFLVSLASFMFFSIFIKKQTWSNEKKIKTNAFVRNLIFFIFLIVTIFLWSVEIKTFALSAAAIVAALFVAFKEVLLSFVGSIISNKSFKVGDFIQYEGFQGQIIDKTFLNTVVLISEPFKSKELIYPNMIYITNKILNLSNYGKFQTFSTTFTLPNYENFYQTSIYIKQIADKLMLQHKERIESYFKQKTNDEIFFESPSLETQITYDLSNIKNLSFTIHYISHPLDKKEIEDKIVKEFLNYTNKLKF